MKIQHKSELKLRKLHIYECRIVIKDEVPVIWDDENCITLDKSWCLDYLPFPWIYVKTKNME